MIDLNGLKQINDTYGHSAGDAAIIAAAESIQEVFQDIGKCYRIGGWNSHWRKRAKDCPTR